MKNLTLAIIFPLLIAASALSQDRPRFADNFENGRSLQIVRTSSPVVVTRDGSRSSESTFRGGSKPRGPSTSTDESPVPANPENANKARKTTKITMTVFDGFSAPDPIRTVVKTGSTMAVGKHLKGYTTGNELFDSYIVDSSRRYNIDPLLIFAQMNQESSFKLRALSNKGASGLMQLMPATARRLGVTQIYDPKQNIEGGVKYMRILLDMFDQNLDLALAGYNAGEGAVIKYGYQIPPYNETRDYVSRISARYRSMTGSASYSRRLPNYSTSQTTGKTYATEAVPVQVAGGRTRFTNK